MPVPDVTDIRPPPRQRRKDARPHELLGTACPWTRRPVAPPLRRGWRQSLSRRITSARLDTAEEIRQIDGPMAPVLRDRLVPWWQQVYASPASGTFKLIITEVRNFPDIAAFYLRELIEPGHELIGTILRRGIASGEFRAVDVEGTVHSLLLPMVMLCTHKHALGACTPHSIDAAQFIADHIELVLCGLLPLPPGRTTVKSPRKTRPLKSA